MAQVKYNPIITKLLQTTHIDFILENFLYLVPLFYRRKNEDSWPYPYNFTVKHGRILNSLWVHLPVSVLVLSASVPASLLVVALLLVLLSVLPAAQLSVPVAAL